MTRKQWTPNFDADENTFRPHEFVMTQTGADGPGPALVVGPEGPGRYTVNFPSGAVTKNFPAYDMRYPTQKEWRRLFKSKPPAYCVK